VVYFLLLFILCHFENRLSGTGSSGATIRLYIEQYTDDKARLKEDAQKALADIIKVTGERHAGGQQQLAAGVSMLSMPCMRMLRACHWTHQQ
jgi:hypothetical protein